MAYFAVENVTKSFGSTKVLKGVSFSMEKGEVLSVIGSSGSGKTTLLRGVNFLTPPDTGRFYLEDACFYDAERDKRLSEREFRQKRLNFGLVFQSFNLFPQYNVLNNLTLAPRLAAKGASKEALAEISANALELLERVGLGDKAKNYPCELSGGQQQRVAIARALMLSPKVLCFDEPTSALDPELTGEVLRVLKDLAKENITMIVVTHEMKFAREVSDKVIFMADGIIEEEGAPEQLFDNPRSSRLRSFLASTRE
ncbi:MAG: amino acid ABC transporter ATP-binding protein [Clostridia bacterium]|nr:amino acid ABC transporter ATP-binding protein [Clostridia bacterium]